MDVTSVASTASMNLSGLSTLRRKIAADFYSLPTDIYYTTTNERIRIANTAPFSFSSAVLHIVDRVKVVDGAQSAGSANG